MRIEDTIQLKVATQTEDEYYNISETISWIDLGKCCIFPNTQATETDGEYNKIRSYQYTIVMRKPRTRYPVENDVIRIQKKDGSINKEVRVTGFVTLRNWIKLWASE